VFGTSEGDPSVGGITFTIHAMRTGCEMESPGSGEGPFVASFHRGSESSTSTEGGEFF
jgi:hypothetical protein